MLFAQSKYKTPIKILATALLCLFLANGIAWTGPSSFSDNPPSAYTLAAASRLSPFFEKNGLDFRTMATVIYAAAALKDLTLSGSLRENHVVNLNKLFPSGAVTIDTAIRHGSLSSGKEYRYAVFDFAKEKKSVNALFIKDHAALTDTELSELGIGKGEAHHLDCPGLEGIWFAKELAPTRTTDRASGIPPAGSIYSVFKYLCDEELTEHSNGISGKLLAQKVGKDHPKRRKALSFESIETDLRALSLHLHLIERDHGTGRDAVYYVPEAVRRKAARILPVLEQFRRESLRPGAASLDRIYRDQIKPIVSGSDIGSATLAFRIMNEMLQADLTENINVMVTYKCPFSCAHCLAKDALKSGKGRDVEQDQLYRLFDQLKGFEKIHLVGPGEPLAYGKTRPDKHNVSTEFLEVIRYAAARIDEVRIVTNGYLFPENINKAEAFFSQFPDNIVWQLSIDGFHEDQFDRMPGRQNGSLRRVVSMMERLAGKGLIRTSYAARVEPHESKYTPIRHFGLERKYDRDPSNIFVNNVIAQGSAKTNIRDARELDDDDIREHGAFPANLFPFIDTEGYLITSDHVAYMTESQRKRLSRTVPRRYTMPGNMNSSPLGELIVNSLLFGNYENDDDLAYRMRDIDPEIFKSVLKAVMLYQDGDKKAAIALMSGLTRKGKAAEKIPAVIQRLPFILENFPLEYFMEDCAKANVPFFERRGKKKIDPAAAVKIFLGETDASREFNQIFIEEYSYHEPLPLLYFLGECPVYSIERYAHAVEMHKGIYVGDDSHMYVSMTTPSHEAVEERFSKDLELAADGIVDNPVAAIYNPQRKRFAYIAAGTDYVDMRDDVQEAGEFIGDILYSAFPNDKKTVARRIGEFAAKLDRHHIAVIRGSQAGEGTLLMKRDDGSIAMMGEYLMKRGKSTPTAKELFRNMMDDEIERWTPRSREENLKKMLHSHFAAGYKSGMQKRAPRGSIEGIFTRLCDAGATNAENAVTGEKLAGPLSFESVKDDLRNLTVHLHLIEKVPGSGTGKDARYYVPESVKKKRADIVPLLARFRGEFLRPRAALLDVFYEEKIRPLLGSPGNPAGEIDVEIGMIHAANLRSTPTLPDKTILCHIIADSILPDQQAKDGMLNRLEAKMRDMRYREKVVALPVKDPGNAEEFMATLEAIKARERDRYKGYEVRFDVACPTQALVEKIQGDGVPALAFARDGDGDMVQVEGIVLALRALRAGSVADLTAVYKLLTGKDLVTDTADIDAVARTILFILPVRKADIEKIGTLNRLIEENIKTAA